MRHRCAHRKLNRTSSHRKALLKNLAKELLKHGFINTTLPKAKELRKFVEPLITLAKKPTLANRRLAFSKIGDHQLVAKLFNEIAPRSMNRPGGYTRVLKNGFRAGDNAPFAFMELVDREESTTSEAKEEVIEAVAS